MKNFFWNLWILIGQLSRLFRADVTSSHFSHYQDALGKTVAKHRIVSYCESFPYCESSSFIKFNVGQSINIPLLRVFILLRSLLLRVSTVFFEFKKKLWKQTKIYSIENIHIFQVFDKKDCLWTFNTKHSRKGRP